MPQTEVTRQPISDSFIADLLDEQQSLTAVERFSQVHETISVDSTSSHATEHLYRELLPASAPREGEQYAFEVDLDACSGCKACVVACHNLNGLEEEELWRDVGLLVGGSDLLPIVQHVTTACHHCVDPACLSGCPVKAYEKDPETGIVRHLDDQCIGCQYCILKCPYEIPTYSKSKGIVRKCDMCSQRLKAGEAPACVQSCPNQAIRIQTVKQETIREEYEVHPFMPGSPDPSITYPTTVFKSEKPLPKNTLPADYFRVQHAHEHLPLVIMLVLTQMSVGAFSVVFAMNALFSVYQPDIFDIVRPWNLAAALGLAILGLNTAILHLGRPLYAYRALLGIMTSWLSREILAFNVFGAAATLYVGMAYLDWSGWQNISFTPAVLTSMGALASVTGVIAVMTSVMVYCDTKRPCWTFGRTTTKFMLTCLVLGLPTTLLVSLITASFSEALSIQEVMSDHGHTLCIWLMVSIAAKLFVEICELRHLSDAQHSPLKRSALLLVSDLKPVLVRRLLIGFIGGIVLPLVLYNSSSYPDHEYYSWIIGSVAVLTTLLLLAGELFERYLFFVSSVVAKMPGAPAA